MARATRSLRAARTRRGRARLAQTIEFAGIACALTGTLLLFGAGVALVGTGAALFVIAQGIEGSS